TVTGTNSGKTGSTSLTVGPGAASLNTSTFTGAPASIVADGSSTATVTLHLKDSLGNDLGAADGSTIAFTTGLGSVGGATDNGDGTYTATLTAGTTAGTATVSATRNGTGFAQSFAVTLVPGPVSAGVSTAAASPGSVVADGSSTATITVTLKDVNGNAVSGKAVTLGQAAGSSTISPASQVTDGSGHAVFTVKDGVAESVMYTATDTTDSIVVGQTAGVDFVPGAASLTNSTISAAPSPITADGSATATVTVRLKDALNNDLTGSGGTVALSSTRGSLSAVTDHGDGTY